MPPYCTISAEVVRQLADAEDLREADVELRQLIASNVYDLVQQKLFLEGGYNPRTFQEIGINGTPRDKAKLHADLSDVAGGLGFRSHEWNAS